MARGILSKEEINILKENKYVAAVSETQIVYTNEFKFYFMREYNKGKKPTQIFREAGFDPKIVGDKRIERAAYRWKKTYESGTLGRCKESPVRKQKIRDMIEAQKELDHTRYMKVMEMLQKEIDILLEENARLKRKLDECNEQLNLYRKKEKMEGEIIYE